MQEDQPLRDQSPEVTGERARAGRGLGDREGEDIGSGWGSAVSKGLGERMQEDQPLQDKSPEVRGRGLGGGSGVEGERGGREERQREGKGIEDREERTSGGWEASVNIGLGEIMQEDLGKSPKVKGRGWGGEGREGQAVVKEGRKRGGGGRAGGPTTA